MSTASSSTGSLYAVGHDMPFARSCAAVDRESLSGSDFEGCANDYSSIDAADADESLSIYSLDVGQLHTTRRPRHPISHFCASLLSRVRSTEHAPTPTSGSPHRRTAVPTPTTTQTRSVLVRAMEDGTTTKRDIVRPASLFPHPRRARSYASFVPVSNPHSIPNSRVGPLPSGGAKAKVKALFRSKSHYFEKDLKTHQAASLRAFVDVASGPGVCFTRVVEETVEFIDPQPAPHVVRVEQMLT